MQPEQSEVDRLRTALRSMARRKVRDRRRASVELAELQRDERDMYNACRAATLKLAAANEQLKRATAELSTLRAGRASGATEVGYVDLLDVVRQAAASNNVAVDDDAVDSIAEEAMDAAEKDRKLSCPYGGCPNSYRGPYAERDLIKHHRHHDARTAALLASTPPSDQLEAGDSHLKAGVDGTASVSTDHGKTWSVPESVKVEDGTFTARVQAKWPPAGQPKAGGPGVPDAPWIPLMDEVHRQIEEAGAECPEPDGDEPLCMSIAVGLWLQGWRTPSVAGPAYGEPDNGAPVDFNG